jgi:hypothetical protein
MKRGQDPHGYAENDTSRQCTAPVFSIKHFDVRLGEDVKKS